MAEATQGTRKGPHRIRFDDNRPVVVHPADQDLFVVSSEQAVRACVTQEMIEQFTRDVNERFKMILKRIAQWSAERPQIVQALIGSREPQRRIILFIVEGNEHNFDLSDDISSLDEEIHDILKGLPAVSVMSIPQGVESGLDAFIDIDESFEIYARSTEPQTSSETIPSAV